MTWTSFAYEFIELWKVYVIRCGNCYKIFTNRWGFPICAVKSDNNNHYYYYYYEKTECHYVKAACGQINVRTYIVRVCVCVLAWLYENWELMLMVHCTVYSKRFVSVHWNRRCDEMSAFSLNGPLLLNLLALFVRISNSFSLSLSPFSHFS